MSTQLPKIKQQKKSLYNIKANFKTQPIDYSSKKSSQNIYNKLISEKLITLPKQRTLKQYISKNKKKYSLSVSNNCLLSQISGDLDIQNQSKTSDLNHIHLNKIINPKHTPKNYQQHLNKIVKKLYSHSQKQQRALSLNHKSRIIIKQKNNANINNQFQQKQVVSSKYDRVIDAYEQYRSQNDQLSDIIVQIAPKKLQNGKNAKQQQLFNIFFQELKRINTFFSKIDDIVGLQILKIGKIRILDPNKYLYKQNDVAKSLFIILWGEVKLKHRSNKIVQYCITGEHLGQETVLQRQQIKSKRNMLETIHIRKGAKPRKESARTITKCGFLEISCQNYKQIKQQLLLLGLKIQFYMAQKMITWSYYRKKHFYHG